MKTLFSEREKSVEICNLGGKITEKPALQATGSLFAVCRNNGLL
ncbi:MAG: hypothetical protein ACRDCS_12960 [Tannerellaceae bacterium]